MYGHIDVDEAAKAVNMAIDRGITLFDTAEGYGPYLSEELLAKALGNRRNEIVLVSKVGFNYDDTPTMTGLNSTKSNVIESTEGCLRRLNTDFLDLLLNPLARLRHSHRGDDRRPRGAEAERQDSSLRRLELRHRLDGAVRAERAHCGESGWLSHVRPTHGIAGAALVHGQQCRFHVLRVTRVRIC